MAHIWQARYRLFREDYEAEINNLSNQGYRLIDICGYGFYGVDNYAAIWERSPGPAWVERHLLPQQEHQQESEALREQRFRPVCVSGYEVSGIAHYASLWEQSPGPAFAAFHHITAAQMQANTDALRQQGFRPIDVCGYVAQGQVLFTAIWEQSPMEQWEIRHNLTESQFINIHTVNTLVGFIAKRISSYEFMGQRLYAAIWEKNGHGNEPEITWTSDYDLGLTDIQRNFDAMVKRGFSPVKVNVAERLSGDDPRFSTIWHKPHLSLADEEFIDNSLRVFMTDHSVPGASVALTHRGRLVFARGYGVADTSGTPVTTNHLFRIASISKPITAVAIFKLIEADQLQLDSRVFGANAILGTTYGTPQPTASGYKPNIDMITVQHLLEHTSGWPRTDDPMFGSLNLDHAGLITLMLDRGLTTVPGSTFDYLNFGYCVLGRIIERLSGRSYADYVKRHVLTPCGISDMHIAGDTLTDRRVNEVVYFPQSGNPYGIRVSRMDAHGGWIASATDLVRFLVSVDGFATKPDILASSTIATMTTPTTALPPTDIVRYAKGWWTHVEGNRWHDGSLPGTASILLRSYHEYCWAILANSRRDGLLDPMYRDLDRLMWNVTRQITDWPAFDLF